MSLVDAVSNAGSRIGRYFGIVSALPSAVLVAFVYLLVLTGAWTARPNWATAFSRLVDVNLGSIAALSLLSIVVALVLHPLQFALVQLYEGYWGISDTGRRAALVRSIRYWEHVFPARQMYRYLNGILPAATKNPAVDDHLANWLHNAWAVTAQVDAAFPRRPAEFMPTRLGNVLRRYELQAGAPFGLSAVQVVPQLALVAQQKDVDYLNDQRSSLDLTIRLSATSFLATAAAALFLWNDGLWLLIALGPYGLAYMFYRGAVVSAHEYGTALAALIALNRFALYERLGIPRPSTTADERDQNEELKLLYEFSPDVKLSYGTTRPSPPRVSWWRRSLHRVRPAERAR